jgi:hypothetical protein
VGATYFLADADFANTSRRDADANTLQLDVEAKF